MEKGDMQVMGAWTEEHMYKAMKPRILTEKGGQDIPAVYRRINSTSINSFILFFKTKCQTLDQAVRKLKMSSNYIVTMSFRCG
jgi:hypothetical protein